MDRAFQEEYTERMSLIRLLVLILTHLQLVYLGDLTGLKVSHDFEELDEGEDRILTLKDSRILDNEGMSSLIPYSTLHTLLKTQYRG